MERFCESTSEKEFHSITGLPQAARKISNKQFNPTTKRARKRTTDNARVSRKKERMKIRQEINDIETKNTKDQ